MSDVTLQQVNKDRYNIIRNVHFHVQGQPVFDYPDIVGTVRRLKNTKRKRIGKAQPEYYWQVSLEGGEGRAFFDEDEALAWARAVLELT